MTDLDSKIEREYDESFRRAFVDDIDKGTILFDGHVARNEFLRNGISYGLREGILCVRDEQDESQYTAVYYGLTQKGKEYLFPEKFKKK